eukprot:4626160-Pyramimonas_sp.AAC.3
MSGDPMAHAAWLRFRMWSNSTGFACHPLVMADGSSLRGGSCVRHSPATPLKSHFVQERRPRDGTCWGFRPLEELVRPQPVRNKYYEAFGRRGRFRPYRGETLYYGRLKVDVEDAEHEQNVNDHPEAHKPTDREIILGHEP